MKKNKAGKGSRTSAGIGIRGFRGVRHCTKCKDGRLIELREPRCVLFCGFCGYEPVK